MYHSAREPEPLRLPSVIFEVTCHANLGVEVRALKIVRLIAESPKIAEDLLHLLSLLRTSGVQ